MGGRGRDYMNYVEVSESDSDGDVFVPESSNNSSGAQSRLKRQKTSAPNALPKASAANMNAGESKTPPRKAYGDASSEIIELDGSPMRKTGTVKESATSPHSKSESPSKSDGVENDEVGATAPEKVEKTNTSAPDAMGTKLAHVEADDSEDEIKPRKSKPRVNYKDDSDDSFKMDDDISDSEDSSSEFEAPVSKKSKSSSKKSSAAKKASTPKTATRKAVKRSKPAVKYDSDASFDLGDENKEGDDSDSEFEAAPKKKGVKKAAAKPKATPAKKTVARRATAAGGASGTKRPASKIAKSSAGGKRLGARPAFKPLLQKVDASAGSSSTRKEPLKTLLSGGPRYRSGLSRKQPIANRLHAYKDEKKS